jgi:TonB family protein
LSQDYEDWVKSQPRAYQDALEATWDPYVVAAALNDFMNSRRAKAPPHSYSELETVLKKLKVPEAKDTAAAEPLQEPGHESNQRSVQYPSLAEELNRELDRVLEDLKKTQSPPDENLPEPARETKPMFREPQAVSTPGPTASVGPSGPDTKIRAPGMTGSDQYLSRVRARISSMWTAPPVDISGKSLTVIMRFRLERDGRVSSVMIEQSSGNKYYDMSAHRAIQSAVPFPPFPPDLTVPYLDTHFTFVVGAAP